MAAAALAGLAAGAREALGVLRGPCGQAAAAGGSFERDRLCAALGAASRAATGLSLAAASAGPEEEEAVARLCAEARGALREAAAAAAALPEARGRALGRAVRAAVAEVAEGLLRLAAALLSGGGSRAAQLVCTGGVWEACERAGGLPADNQAAVAAALASALATVRDAAQELQQALAEGGGPHRDVLGDEEVGSGGNGDVPWSEADRQLLTPCVALVKAAKACLKKLLGAVNARGKVDTAEQVAQLDDLADAAGDVSPSVDELVLSTYPPVNRLTLRLNAGKLAAVLKKVLEATRASHICVPSEESWVQFLSGAVDHNMDKIKVLTQGVL